MYTKRNSNLSSPYFSSTTSKRLIYLDQSFLSEVCLRDGRTDFEPILERLFVKLQNLKTINKIVLVVSDIHCRETSDFPRKYPDKMEKLWRFQNGLADGRIAANWTEVFVAQHRRLLSGKGSDSYPLTDIRLRDPLKVHHGIRIIMTNSWLLRIHRDGAAKRNVIDDRYRQIIDRQAKNIPRCDGVTDCLNYIGELWRDDIQSRIVAWRQHRDFLLSFEQFEKSLDVEQPASLRIPEQHDTSFIGFINDVTRGLDGETVLSKWSDLLEKDPIGSCPSLRNQDSP
jgi:hypothetical protein